MGTTLLIAPQLLYYRVFHRLFHRTVPEGWAALFLVAPQFLCYRVFQRLFHWTAPEGWAALYADWFHCFCLNTLLVLDDLQCSGYSLLYYRVCFKWASFLYTHLQFCVVAAICYNFGPFVIPFCLIMGPYFCCTSTFLVQWRICFLPKKKKKDPSEPANHASKFPHALVFYNALTALS